MVVKESLSLSLTILDFDIDTFSKWIFGIFFTIILIAWLFTLAGALTLNKNLNYLGTWRIVIFGLSASIPWLIGFEFNNSYRGSLGRWFKFYYEMTVNGYWGLSSEIPIFQPVKDQKNGGQEFSMYQNYVNLLLLQIIFACICRTLAFFGTEKIQLLSRCVMTGFSVQFLHRFIWFCKQHYLIGKENESGKGYNRATVGHVFGWIFGLLGFTLVLENTVVMFQKAFEAKNWKKGRKSAYSQASRGQSSQSVNRFQKASPSQDAEGEYSYSLFRNQTGSLPV